MTRLIAATLLGPDEEYWDTCRTSARWADHHIIVKDEHGEAWGNEAPWRKRLWQEAMAACGEDDWIFVLDSDFVVAGDLRLLTQAGNADAWAFPVYDLWERKPTSVPGNRCGFACGLYPECQCGAVRWFYRDDEWWRGHHHPRAWMFRARAFRDVPWEPERGIHTGHAPPVSNCNIGLAPRQYAILHLGWTPDVRPKKYERYKQVWAKLSPQERQHVESILDPSPNLRELPSQYLRALDGVMRHV